MQVSTVILGLFILPLCVYNDANYVGCSDRFHRYSNKSMGTNIQHTTTPPRTRALSLYHFSSTTAAASRFCNEISFFFLLFLLYIAQTCKIPSDVLFIIYSCHTHIAPPGSYKHPGRFYLWTPKLCSDDHSWKNKHKFL